MWWALLLLGFDFRPVVKKTSLSSTEVCFDIIEGSDGTSDSNSEELSASIVSQLKQYPLYKMLHNNSGATVMFNGQQLQFTAQQIRWSYVCVCVCMRVLRYVFVVMLYFV